MVIEPYFRWIVVFDDDPYSDIEFAFVDDEGVLYVLLDYVLGLFAQAGVQDIIQI